MSKLVNKEDLDAWWEYHDGPAQSYTGMSYAEGRRRSAGVCSGGRNRKRAHRPRAPSRGCPTGSDASSGS